MNGTTAVCGRRPTLTFPVALRTRAFGCACAVVVMVGISHTAVAAGPSHAVPTVRLSMPSSSSTYGQSIIVTATVQGASAAPTGAVTFRDGASSIGTVGLGTVVPGVARATLTVAALPVGSHSLTGEYGGDGKYVSAGSSRHTVTVAMAATNLAIVSSSPGNSSALGQQVTFTATVLVTAQGTGALSPTGTVNFVIDGKQAATGSVSGARQATEVTRFTTLGKHTVSAAYTGSSTYASTAPASLEQSVIAVPTPSPTALATAPAAPTVEPAPAPAPASNGARMPVPTAVSSPAGTVPVRVTGATPFTPGAGTFLPSGEVAPPPVLGAPPPGGAADLTPAVLDTGRQVAFQLSGAFAGLNYGAALPIRPFLIAANGVAYVLICMAFARGRRLTRSLFVQLSPGGVTTGPR